MKSYLNKNLEGVKKIYFNQIDKERNIYELATLFQQKRRPVEEYLYLLKDPLSNRQLSIKGEKLVGDNSYSIYDNIPNFTSSNINSNNWEKLNEQFLHYHKSLSVYSAINSSPIINYLSLETEMGLIKNKKVLDIGGGTGHTFCSFFLFPETIEYFLLDPNLRLLHDQFLRFYPKLGILKMAHILANAENLPIKDDSFGVVISLSSIDHFDDYKKFISEAYRVLKPGGKFLISSHLDLPPDRIENPSIFDKIFSDTFFERLSRFFYYKKNKVGNDDHTLSLKTTNPIKNALERSNFKILKEETFKRHFFLIAEK